MLYSDKLVVEALPLPRGSWPWTTNHRPTTQDVWSKRPQTTERTVLERRLDVPVLKISRLLNDEMMTQLI